RGPRPDPLQGSPGANRRRVPDRPAEQDLAGREHARGRRLLRHPPVRLRDDAGLPRGRLPGQGEGRQHERRGRAEGVRPRLLPGPSVPVPPRARASEGASALPDRQPGDRPRNVVRRHALPDVLSDHTRLLRARVPRGERDLGPERPWPRPGGGDREGEGGLHARRADGGRDRRRPDGDRRGPHRGPFRHRDVRARVLLMMEGIGWASINEVPLVITLYQRAGPSTGMPTRHEQGDLRFALHAGHGESPRIVLASGDFEECIRDGFLSFNLAERYQMPVIHLVDKALANSYATIAPPNLSDLRIDRGLVANGNNGYSKDNPYKRFNLANGPVSARALLGQEGTIFWNTGDEHDEMGHITEDPGLGNAMMEKRFAKLDLAAKEIPQDVKLTHFGPKDAGTVIVSFTSCGISFAARSSFANRFSIIALRRPGSSVM